MGGAIKAAASYEPGRLHGRRVSAEIVALATALAEKDPKTALAPAKLALNSGAEADAALHMFGAESL